MTYCPSVHERGTDNKHYLLNSYLESHAVRSSSCACLWFSRPPPSPCAHVPHAQYCLKASALASSPGNALPPLGMFCPRGSFPSVFQCHLLTEAFPDPPTYNSTLPIILYPLTLLYFPLSPDMCMFTWCLFLSSRV